MIASPSLWNPLTKLEYEMSLLSSFPQKVNNYEMILYIILSTNQLEK